MFLRVAAYEMDLDLVGLLQDSTVLQNSAVLQAG